MKAIYRFDWKTLTLWRHVRHEPVRTTNSVTFPCTVERVFTLLGRRPLFSSKTA